MLFFSKKNIDFRQNIDEKELFYYFLDKNDNRLIFDVISKLENPFTPLRLAGYELYKWQINVNFV